MDRRDQPHSGNRELPAWLESSNWRGAKGPRMRLEGGHGQPGEHGLPHLGDLAYFFPFPLLEMPFSLVPVFQPQALIPPDPQIRLTFLGKALRGRDCGLAWLGARVRSVAGDGAPAAPLEGEGLLPCLPLVLAVLRGCSGEGRPQPRASPASDTGRSLGSLQGAPRTPPEVELAFGPSADSGIEILGVGR